MWVYEKKLQYPINIKNTNAKLAKMIISQYGGPDGELGASLRYLSQRFSMPYPELKAILTDIGKEEKYCAFRKKLWKRSVFCNKISVQAVFGWVCIEKRYEKNSLISFLNYSVSVLFWSLFRSSLL